MAKTKELFTTMKADIPMIMMIGLTVMMLETGVEEFKLKEVFNMQEILVENSLYENIHKTKNILQTSV
jgi:C4-dicarboxylate transporter